MQQRSTGVEVANAKKIDVRGEELGMKGGGHKQGYIMKAKNVGQTICIISYTAPRRIHPT